MVPAPEYKYIDAILNEEWFSLGTHDAHGIPVQHNLVGFIFFDQSIQRDAVSDFLDNLTLLNEHSGRLIHFFLPGVSFYGPNNGDHAVCLGELRGVRTYHNVKAFLSFKDEFEKRIPEWQYDFGVTIVLIDIINIAGRRELDFSSAIFFNVEEFIGLKIVDRTTELITKLIKFRRDSKLDSALDAKLLLQQQFGINWFKSLVLALFPKAIQDLARAQAVLGGGSAIR